MRRIPLSRALTAAIGVMSFSLTARADLSTRTGLAGDAASVADVDLGSNTTRWRAAWRGLSELRVSPGAYTIRFDIPSDAEALELPACAGRSAVTIQGQNVPIPDHGPQVIPLAPFPGDREVILRVNVSRYERRIACGSAPKFGRAVRSSEGFRVLSFESSHRGPFAGRAVTYIPRGHDKGKPAALLVGAHPWNGDPWTYAAYAELIESADRNDVVLLMPSGLGNSLYTRDAEREVLDAIDALGRELAIDRRRVSIWGASMGGAGATTISFHHPDRFAFVASFFGDSRYDLTTYVRSILHSEAEAHRVNALDVVDNARYLPVWLFHGDSDRVSAFAQSQMLFDAMKRRGFQVRFERIAGGGHDGALVARFLPEIVAEAANTRVPEVVSRVIFRSARPEDTAAYGVQIERASSADAYVDVERQGDNIVVREAQGVRSVDVIPSRFGLLGQSPTRIFDASSN